MFDLSVPGPVTALIGLAIGLAATVVLVSLSGRKVSQGRGRWTRTIATIILLTAATATALITLWVAWIRLLPWDASVVFPLLDVAIVGAVAVLAPALVWMYLRRSQVHPGARATAFHKAVISLLFLAVALTSSALLFQSASKFPVPSGVGPEVTLATDGAETVHVSATVANFREYKEAGIEPSTGWPRMAFALTPADELVGRAYIRIKLMGVPGSNVKFAIQGDRRAVGDNPGIFGTQDYESRPLTKEDRFVSFSGIAASATCTPPTAERKTAHFSPPENALLILGSVNLDVAGSGELIVIPNEEREWFDATGSINTVRLPYLRTLGVVPNECLTGIGALEGYWKTPVSTEIEILAHVVGMDFAKVEVFPEEAERASNSIPALQWTTKSAPTSSGTSLAPFYIIESPGTKDRSSSHLFLAAVLLGGAFTVMYELVRDLPPKVSPQSTRKPPLGGGSRRPRLHSGGSQRSSARIRREPRRPFL